MPAVLFMSHIGPPPQKGTSKSQKPKATQTPTNNHDDINIDKQDNEALPIRPPPPAHTTHHPSRPNGRWPATSRSALHRYRLRCLHRCRRTCRRGEESLSTTYLSLHSLFGGVAFVANGWSSTEDNVVVIVCLVGGVIDQIFW